MFGVNANISSWLQNYINRNSAPVRTEFFITELDGVGELTRRGVQIISEDDSKIPIHILGLAPVLAIKDLIGQPYVTYMQGAPKNVPPTSGGTAVNPVLLPSTALSAQDGPAGSFADFWANYKWYLIGGIFAIAGIALMQARKIKKRLPSSMLSNQPVRKRDGKWRYVRG